MSRAPHGARGLKPDKIILCWCNRGRAPHGARGLKQATGEEPKRQYWSRPTRGAWIETPRRGRRLPMRMSRPTWGAWIETEKLGERIVKSSATFPYRMLFRLGLKKLVPCVKIV